MRSGTRIRISWISSLLSSGWSVLTELKIIIAQIIIVIIVTTERQNPARLGFPSKQTVLVDGESREKPRLVGVLKGVYAYACTEAIPGRT